MKHEPKRSRVSIVRSWGIWRKSAKLKWSFDMRRGFNKAAAIKYLGVGRRFFEANIMPCLDGKGTRAGTALIFEKEDLDTAWDKYKMAAGNMRHTEKSTWSKKVQRPKVSTHIERNTWLIANTKANAFEKEASRLLGRQSSI